MALTIAYVTVSICQCLPIYAFWESLGGALAPALGFRCINVNRYFLAAGAINTVTNFVVLALVRFLVPLSYGNFR